MGIGIYLLGGALLGVAFYMLTIVFRDYYYQCLERGLKCNAQEDEQTGCSGNTGRLDVTPEQAEPSSTDQPVDEGEPARTAAELDMGDD